MNILNTPEFQNGFCKGFVQSNLLVAPLMIFVSAYYHTWPLLFISSTAFLFALLAYPYYKGMTKRW